MAGYYSLTTADNGKKLAFTLQRIGAENAAATLCLKDQNGILSTRPLWNASSAEWEYSVVAGEFAAGRWRAMVAVMLGTVGPLYTNELIFDVRAAD
jgi:hypothetical protein